MQGLTSSLLGRACRVFLTLAYHNNLCQLPAAKAAFLQLIPEQPVEAVLVPPVCQPLHTPEGDIRGYALRLGSAEYPHLKLEVVRHADDACLFSVNTHDTRPCPPDHPDAADWCRLQAANRQLKHLIERAWEAEGVLTFNALLRRGLEEQSRPT